jgi:plastocyanin
VRAVGRGAVAASFLAAAALAACGGSGGGGGGGGASGDGGSGLDAGGVNGASSADLEVLAQDIGFDRDSYSLESGQRVIEYVLDGETRHTLKIEDADGDDVDGLDLEVGGPETDNGSVDLAPGRYTLYCDVAGHREAGMEAELDVR